MTVQIDFVGASGVSYRYYSRDGQRLSPSGGNYVFARETPDGLAVIFVGEAESLMNQADDRWPEAAERYGATHAFVRLNVTASIRRQEQQDLVSAYAPPMNTADQARSVG